MFGGSAEARVVDAEAPIRVATIRGQLRFWWRAARPSESSDALFRAEKALWGAASTVDDPSEGAVSLALEDLHRGQEVHLDALRSAKPSPQHGPLLGYFLFPFEKEEAKDGGPGKPEDSGRGAVRFTLRVTCPPDNQAEVERALTRWLTFGGYGARTRRGCGALAAGGQWALPAEPAALRDRLRTLLAPADSGGADVPTVAGATAILGQEFPDALQAWRELARFWTRFRKGHLPPDVEYSPMNGGKWRDFETLSTRGNRDTVALVKPDLGLPIIYQKFTHKRLPRPFHGAVEPDESGRMASPVILRPVKLANGRFRPLVLVLRAPSPAALKLDGAVVALETPTNDPVLTQLRAEGPLDAVVKGVLKTWDRALIVTSPEAAA
jgi:CRISPR-associated protein Cmr1